MNDRSIPPSVGSPQFKDSFWVPIDPANLTMIASRLRTADVFTPTFAASDIDIYHPGVYRQQLERFDTPTRLLVDRNIFTRWISVVRGTIVTPEHRLAAGVLAFAQCSKIDIEPNMALYEVAQRSGSMSANEELALFRVADSYVHPGYWGDVALGVANGVYLGDIPSDARADAPIDFEMPLRRWRRNYILALKLAELELVGGNSAKRYSLFMRWMYDEFLIGAGAALLAAVYLAPNQQKSGLLKGLRSTDRERAIEGIKNATWDLSLVSEFITAVEQQQNRGLTLLASFDRNVHFIARHVADGASDLPPTNSVAVLLSKVWGAEIGSRFARELEEYSATRESTHRKINQQTGDDFIDNLIRHGEDAIRRWRAKNP